MREFIETIKIKNFKAFQQEEIFDIKGKNILIYGTNGSGKSSFFWALYTFLQSSIKSDNEVKKYFESYDIHNNLTHQSLKNVFVTDGEDSYVELTISNENDVKKTYKIGHNLINTNKNSDTKIQELNLASDFINYKLLHNFYNSSHKQELNLWPVFERDIFPFLTEGTRNWLDDIIKKDTLDVPRTPTGNVVSQKRKENYIEKLDSINSKTQLLLDDIEEKANRFLQEEFFNNEEVLKVKLVFQKKFTFEKVRKKLWENGAEFLRQNELQIKLTISVKEESTGSWKTVNRPQSFLNEAQLTRIAIAIRIGATMTRLESKFKILVLDDMLISLDMSNRMDVMRLILNTENKQELRFFDNFQKIILTHDRGFYNLIKRHTDDNNWLYYKFVKDETKNEPPKITLDLINLEKIERIFEESELENCGNELRKEAEDILTHYLDPDMKKMKNEFESLGDKLNKSLSEINNNRFQKFKSGFISELNIDTLKKIKEDYSFDASLSDDDKKYLDKLKGKLFDLMIDLNIKKNFKEKALLNTKEILDRIMNAASHSTDNPLYTSELKKAIEDIKKLKTVLNQD